MPEKRFESLPASLRPKLYLISVLAAAMALAGIMLISRYASMDLMRDLRTWQDKMNLIVVSRAEEVNDWVDTHFYELKKLSENPALQLYLGELQRANEGEQPAVEEGAEASPKPAITPGAMNGAEEEMAQRTYLRNLLTFTSDSLGFTPEHVPLSINIPTQIEYEAPSGLAVISADTNEVIVSTPYFNALDEHALNQLKSIPFNTPALIDLYKATDEDKKVVKVGFVVPVYGIQEDPGSAKPIARIVGIKMVGAKFFDLLKPVGTAEKSLETLLVRREGGNIAYLSPLMNGTSPMQKYLSDNPDRLAGALAVDKPGALATRYDYRGIKTLVMGRTVPDTPWTLVLKIDYDEAMAASNMRRGAMITIFLLAVAIVVITIVAVWYGASSRRAVVASHYFKDLAGRTSAQKRLLKLVTDNQPEALYIIDNEDKYRFGNPRAAMELGTEDKELSGRRIEDVIGAAKAKEVSKAAALALKNQEKVSRIRRIQDNDQERIIKTNFIPLEHIPLPGLAENTPGVLVVEQDITELMHEREQRLRLHQQIIDTLIMLVDRRDPHAANHSKMVSTLSYEVADKLELDTETVQAVRVAGSLLNIGKIVVAPELLTKADSLTVKERKEIQSSISSSAELLKNISFDGPVMQILEQVQEAYDGSGRLKMKGEDIEMGARIIAVVNAFVGMISQRSYRLAMSEKEALKILLDEADKKYDRKVVLALANYIENQGGKAMIKRLKAA